MLLNPMLTAELKRELGIALESAMMLQQAGVSIPQLAERIYDSEPALMEQLKRPLIIERLIWLMNRQRQQVPSQEQMLLPGFPHLPQRITLKNGGRPFLMEANIKQLGEFRQVLLKRKGARLKIVERLIAFMRPYARKNPKITVSRLVTLEVQKSLLNPLQP